MEYNARRIRGANHSEGRGKYGPKLSFRDDDSDDEKGVGGFDAHGDGARRGQHMPSEDEKDEHCYVFLASICVAQEDQLHQ